MLILFFTSKQLRINRGHQHHGLGSIPILQKTPKGGRSLIPQRNVHGYIPVTVEKCRQDNKIISSYEDKFHTKCLTL